ncbi:hypothetical protein M1432_00365 [Patescibacteria group bacterium]|nr:hypothetical protein [Patescibacteria group bacterium]
MRNHRWTRTIVAIVLRAVAVMIPRRTVLAAKVHFVVANLCHDSSNIGLAKRHFDAAVADARFAGDELLLADILRKRGFFKLNVLKDLPGSFKDIDESVQIVEKEIHALTPLKEQVDDATWLERRRAIWRVAANAYAALNNYHFDTGDMLLAEMYCERAIFFARQAGYRERVITLMGDIGNVYIRSRSWDKAVRALEETNAMAKKSYHHAVPSSYMRLSAVYSDIDSPYYDPDEALRCARSALSWARRSKWPKETKEAQALVDGLMAKFNQ